MIARCWHGRTLKQKAGAYRNYLLEHDVPLIRALQGNLDVQVLERAEGETTQFVVLSWWESLDAIRAFTGNEADLAQYSPEDKDYLIEFETHVLHYEVCTISAPDR